MPGEGEHYPEFLRAAEKQCNDRGFNRAGSRGLYPGARMLEVLPDLINSRG